MNIAQIAPLAESCPVRTTLHAERMGLSRRACRHAGRRRNSTCTRLAGKTTRSGCRYLRSGGGNRRRRHRL